MSHEAFVRRVRVAMAAGGIRNKDLAESLGTREDMVSLWVTGRRAPSLAYLEKMPAALGVNGHWLLTGEGPMGHAEALKHLELLERVLGPDGVARLLRIADAMAAHRIGANNG